MSALRISAVTVTLAALRAAADAIAASDTSIASGLIGDVRGDAVPAGHFFPEERPDQTAERLREFLESGK
jgi:pimeloyl-ACP methyl ester carboxylesterase